MTQYEWLRYMYNERSYSGKSSDLNSSGFWYNRRKRCIELWSTYRDGKSKMIVKRIVGSMDYQALLEAVNKKSLHRNLNILQNRDPTLATFYQLRLSTDVIH